jgi:thiosulfate reductase cytochrome b subunit
VNATTHSPTEVRYRLDCNWDHVREVRGQVYHLIAACAASGSFAERTAMCASELLENAVKYGLPDQDIWVRVRYSALDFQAVIEVENVTIPRYREDLHTTLAQVNAGPPLEAYILLLRESATKDGVASKVGLGRTRAEAGADVSVRAAGDRVRVIAAVPRRLHAVSPEEALAYARRQRARTRKAQLMVTVCHWAAVLLIGVNLATGMRLAWGFEHSALGGSDGAWGSFLDAVAPQGAVLRWHTVSAWLLGAVVVTYVVYLLRTKESRRVRFRVGDVTAVARALRHASLLADKRALWSANVLLYWVAFALVGLLFVSGAALYRPGWRLDALLGGYLNARFLHAAAAYLLVPYAILHALCEWKFGTLWSIFKAAFGRRRLLAGALAVGVGALVVALLHFWDEMPPTLQVRRIPPSVAPPVVDGDSDDPAWRGVPEVTVASVKGVNFPGSTVDIHVAAVRDDERVYLRFRWRDPTRSGKRYPLLKTATGWRVLGSRFEQSDEMAYYEDKIAVYLTAAPGGACADSCHLGRDPLGRGRGATWGLHYTNGPIADVWHWKLVRTDSMGELRGEPGYADDQHFGPPQDPVPGERYTGGYFPDSKTGGGYRYNYVKLDAAVPLAQARVEPVRVPERLETSRDAMRAGTHDVGRWWIHEAQSTPYSAAADDYPIGTLLPNILVAPFVGDRGDVRAKGRWQAGTWTVEMTRALATGSRHDVAFLVERPVFLSVAAFDRTQTRHSEHIEPVRLVLER